MNFDWEEYLELAKELTGLKATSISEEAYIRCAISRAYYAAFCKARNYLRDKKKIGIPRVKTHKFVIKKFKCSNSPKWQAIGNNLNRLREDRNQADYDDKLAGYNLDKQVKFDLLLAEQIINYLKSL